MRFSFLQKSKLIESEANDIKRPPCDFLHLCLHLYLNTTTMSTLSNAEKQKLLRERRQAKLKAGGGARLNKITSSNSAFAKSTATDDNNTAVAAKENQTATPVAPKIPKAKVSNNRSNRISSILEAPPSFINLREEDIIEDAADGQHDDPEIEDIGNLNFGKDSTTISKSAQPSINSFGGINANSSANGGFDPNDVFSNLFSGAGLANPNGGLGGAAGTGDQDIFGQLLSNPNLSSFFGNGGGIPGADNQAAGGPSFFQGTSPYDLYQTNQFKARFLVFRILFLSALVFYSFFNLNIQFFFSEADKFQFDQGSFFFYSYFLIGELLFISYFIVQLTNIDFSFQYDSLIPSSIESMVGMFLPPHVTSSIKLFNKYYQFLSFFTFDVAYVVFLFAILSLMSR